MPIVIQDMMIEPEPTAPRPRGGPDQPNQPPSPSDRLIDQRAAADRRARLAVD